MTRVTFDVEKPIYQALKAKCLETEESIRVYLTRLVMQDIGLGKDKKTYTEEELDAILAPYFEEVVKKYTSGEFKLKSVPLDKLGEL